MLAAFAGIMVAISVLVKKCGDSLLDFKHRTGRKDMMVIVLAAMFLALCLLYLVAPYRGKVLIDFLAAVLASAGVLIAAQWVRCMIDRQNLRATAQHLEEVSASLKDQVKSGKMSIAEASKELFYEGQLANTSLASWEERSLPELVCRYRYFKERVGWCRGEYLRRSQLAEKSEGYRELNAAISNFLGQFLHLLDKNDFSLNFPDGILKGVGNFIDDDSIQKRIESNVVFERFDRPFGMPHVPYAADLLFDYLLVSDRNSDEVLSEIDDAQFARWKRRYGLDQDVPLIDIGEFKDDYLETAPLVWDAAAKLEQVIEDYQRETYRASPSDLPDADGEASRSPADGA